MDFELTTEQAMFKDMAKEFGLREVQPYVKEWDRQCKMPHEVFEKLGAQGLLGIKAPVEYGGLDLDWMTLGLVTEQLSYYDFSSAWVPAPGLRWGLCLCLEGRRNKRRSTCRG